MCKIASISGLVLMLGMYGSTSATIFTVELPGLVGELEPYPNGSTDSFDFGTSFLSIDEVRIRMSGTIEPFSELPAIHVYIFPGVGSCFTDLHPMESPFNIEQAFKLKYGATYDFLLDGIGEVNADLVWAVQPTWGVNLTMEHPSVEISEAYITVEGVVPEPSSILSLILGVILLKRRMLKERVGQKKGG
jgi:hypothetical protein